jgi:hypothetical protein
MKSIYTIKELSLIFKASRKATIRTLRNLNIPMEIKERFQTKIDMSKLKNTNKDLYNSIELASIKAVGKPFYTIRDLSFKFGKTAYGMRRWLKRNNMPAVKCGGKIIVFAASLK